MSTLASDDFNRADGPLVDPPWVHLDEGDAGSVPNIAGGGISGSGARAHAIYTAVTFPDDQWAQCRIDDHEILLFVRATNIGGSQSEYYAFFANTSGAVSIRRFDAGVGFTTLDSDSVSVPGGSTMYFEVQGTSLIGKIDGATVVTATDANFSSGTTGIGVGNVGGDAADNFSAGDFQAGTRFLLTRF